MKFLLWFYLTLKISPQKLNKMKTWKLTEVNYNKLPQGVKTHLFRRQEGNYWILTIDKNYVLIDQLSSILDKINEG